MQGQGPPLELVLLVLAYLGLGRAAAAALLAALAIHHFLFRRLVRDHCRLRKCAVLVTGADSGFGRAIALRLHGVGGTVYAGVLSDEEGAKLRAEVAGSERMRPVRCDVTSDAEVERVVREIGSGDVPLLGLVNNAGIGSFGWCEALPLSSFRANTEVNYLGAVRLSKACLPLLRASRGRIINMGSYGALTPSSFGSAYLSSKAAMRCFSACLEQEVRRNLN
jgi:NAD(P)-dependent dehydrogenase (short-subunit alcohol dehydrogenase family)